MELVPVERVMPGDVVWVGEKVGAKHVSALEAWGDGTYTVVYFLHGELTLENRARSRGPRFEPRWVERSLPSQPKGALVRIEGRALERTEEIRDTMEREQAARNARATSRWRHHAG